MIGPVQEQRGEKGEVDGFEELELSEDEFDLKLHFRSKLICASPALLPERELLTTLDLSQRARCLLRDRRVIALRSFSKMHHGLTHLP